MNTAAVQTSFCTASNVHVLESDLLCMAAQYRHSEGLNTDGADMMGPMKRTPPPLHLQWLRQALWVCVCVVLNGTVTHKKPQNKQTWGRAAEPRRRHGRKSRFSSATLIIKQETPRLVGCRGTQGSKLDINPHTANTPPEGTKAETRRNWMVRETQRQLEPRHVQRDNKHKDSKSRLETQPDRKSHTGTSAGSQNPNTRSLTTADLSLSNSTALWHFHLVNEASICLLLTCFGVNSERHASGLIIGSLLVSVNNLTSG